MPTISGGALVISTEQITNGIIIDEDIAALAAIAYGKLALDNAVLVSDLAAAGIVTESEGIAGNDNDTTIPTSAAVFDHVATTAKTNLLGASGAAQTIKNTSTETNVVSVAVPANTLGTNKAIKVTLFIDQMEFGGNTNRDITFRAKYGATTLATRLITNTTQEAGNQHDGVLEFWLLANASASAQRGIMRIKGYNGDQSNFEASDIEKLNTYDQGTAAEDSTGTLNVVISVQNTQANSQQGVITMGYIVEQYQT